MSIRVLAQRNALATQYGTSAPNGALFSADPGTGGNATNEISGGSPAYARQPWNWGAASNSAISGTATFNVGAGTTITYAGVTVSSVATTNDVRDSVPVTSQTFASQGTYQCTATYTQS